MALHRQSVLLLGVSLLSAALLAAVTVSSLQLACALVLVGAVLVLYRSSRPTGLIALWVLWLAAPGIRRIFGFIDGYVSADPLALAPFVATAGVALLELMRVGLSPRVRSVLTVAMLGLALGLPAAFADPKAGLFGLAAYGSGVLCIVVGYGEGAAGGEGFTLRRALFAATPLVALYGILQYFLPLTSWDDRWLHTVNIASIDSPEAGHIRVFSTLNSPATLAVVLSLAILFIVASRRLSVTRSGILVVLITGLALTFVRSALIGVVGGLIGLAFATRGRVTARIVVLLIATAIPVGALSAVSTTGKAIVDRVATLGAPEKDVSADARLQKTSVLLPEAATTPLGHGLGSAGEAVTLRRSGGLRTTDNGYLALLWQVGPLGFLLLVGAALAAVSMLVRSRLVAADQLELKALLASGLAMMLVLGLGVDVFYGVSGALFWYLVGKALWLVDRAPAPDSALAKEGWPSPDPLTMATPPSAGAAVAGAGSRG